MRILTVSHFYENHGGGIERVAAQLCRQFSRVGETPIWAASADDAPPEGIESIPLPCINPTEKLTGLPMPIPGLKGYRALSSAIRKSDAVIIHDALYATSILAMLLAKKHHKRAILVQHIAAIPFSSPALRSVMKLANRVVTGPMLRAADCRIFISDTVRQELLGEPPSQTYELLFNGVDSSIFHPAVLPKSAPKAVAGIASPEGSHRILFVGRYVAKKGLSVIRDLAKLRPDLSFFLVGSGPIQPLGWKLPNVFDLGPQSQQELADLYGWSDALLLPSVGEGYPLVIQEAMASGLRVVCGEPSNRADPNAASWIKGVRIELSDPGGSAQRCSDAIDELEPVCDDSRTMAEYALENYDWRKMAQSLLALAHGESSRGTWTQSQ